MLHILPLLLLSVTTLAEDKTFMTIWKYYGQKDFKSAHIMSLKKTGKLYDFDQIGQLSSRSFGQPDCKSLLSYNQGFPLAVMQDRDYLTPEQADFQTNIEQTVTPDLVTFTEVAEFAPKRDEDVLWTPHKQKGYALKTIHKVNSRKQQELKKSAMWMIAGQSLSPQGLIPHFIPWQNDPNLSTDPRLQLDREKYPIIWEFGRAGQVHPGLIYTNMRALAILAYQEKKHLERQFGPRKGYVFVHSLGASRTRLFEQSYGATRFPEDWENADDCILMLDIDQLIAKFRPSHLSVRIKTLIDLSGGTLNDLSTLEVLDHNLTSYRQDLDMEGQSEPLVLEDMSLYGYKTLTMAKLKQMGVPDEKALAIFRYLARILYSEESAATTYRDFAQIHMAWRKFAARNSVQISNLNEDSARADKNYVAKVLGGVRRYYIERWPDQESFQKSGIGFSVRTTSRLISKQLLALGSDLQEHKAIDGKKVFVHFFKDAQLKDLAQTRVFEGYWSTRRLLAHPMQF